LAKVWTISNIVVRSRHDQEIDHQLNQVGPWAKQLRHLLRGCTAQRVHWLDIRDDRLAAVLGALSDDTRWCIFGRALNRQLLRVYGLQQRILALLAFPVDIYMRLYADSRKPP
jgi:hypothetical protein